MLVTLANLQIHLGVATGTDDAVITAMGAAATEAMEQYAKRHLEDTEVTEYISGMGGHLLYLKEPPNAITSIHVDSGRAWAAASLVAAADYYLDGCVVEYLDNAWTRAQRNIRAVYQAGFTAIPADIDRACKRQVADMYSFWGAEKRGMDVLESQNIEGWAQKFIARHGLVDEVKEILNHYLPARL